MPKRVLLADDQPDNRIIFAAILQHGGYDVVLASDGQEAIAQALRTRPDLILMDLMMPVMDGWEAIAELQRDGRTAGIPIVAISAHGQDQSVAREVRLAGCHGYLAKPVHPRVLLEAVGRWFASPGPHAWVQPGQYPTG